MSRSGYSEDCDDEYNTANLYMANLERATKGKRGQAFFRAIADALDAMPEKRLVAEELQTGEGEVCALGCLGKARGIDMRGVDTEDWDKLGKLFGIAPSLAREVMFENDDDFGDRRCVSASGRHRETPEERWKHVREWVARQIQSP
jgi:hypothetical protein